MSNFHKPIENRDELRPDWKIPPTQSIEKDKKDEPPFHPKRHTPEEPFYLLLLTTISNFFSLFAKKKTSPLSSSQRERLYDDLLSFRKLLHILGNEDPSHNPEFSWHLAQLWHNLVNDSQNIAYAQPVYAKIKDFINEIQSYPTHADYSLGYYLTEHAGGAWIPFPFLDILQGLHKEHKNDPEASTLSKWMHALTALTDKLK